MADSSSAVSTTDPSVVADPQTLPTPSPLWKIVSGVLAVLLFAIVFASLFWFFGSGTNYICPLTEGKGIPGLGSNSCPAPPPPSSSGGVPSCPAPDPGAPCPACPTDPTKAGGGTDRLVSCDESLTVKGGLPLPTSCQLWSLDPNPFLESSDGRWSLALTGVGKLIAVDAQNQYTPAKPLFDPTQAQAAYLPFALVLQSDGNLVLYGYNTNPIDSSGVHVLWSWWGSGMEGAPSQAWGQAPYSLIVQPQGQVQIVDSSNPAIVQTLFDFLQVTPPASIPALDVSRKRFKFGRF